MIRYSEGPLPAKSWVAEGASHGSAQDEFRAAVAISHAGGLGGYVPMNGDAAVQAFYVISGFYMALVFTEKYSAAETPARTFWISRYLRLAPAYILVSGISLLLVHPDLLDALGAGARSWSCCPR